MNSKINHLCPGWPSCHHQWAKATGPTYSRAWHCQSAAKNSQRGALLYEKSWSFTILYFARKSSMAEVPMVELEEVELSGLQRILMIWRGGWSRWDTQGHNKHLYYKLLLRQETLWPQTWWPLWPRTPTWLALSPSILTPIHQYFHACCHFLIIFNDRYLQYKREYHSSMVDQVIIIEFDKSIINCSSATNVMPSSRRFSQKLVWLFPSF